MTLLFNRITDIMSFRKWWEKQSNRMKDRFTIYLKRNQVSLPIFLVIL